MPLPLPISPLDETFWSSIRAQYTVSPDFINLENGYFSVPAQPVIEALHRYQAQLNKEGTYFMRTQYPQRSANVLRALAAFTGTDEKELVITRNATEAMNILIQGYPFHAGDEVIAGPHEYDSVSETLEMMERRQRFTLVRIELPLHPQNDEDIVARYEQAITPRTRVLIATHMLHRTGQILPIAKITQMARRYGIDVLVDAAHSFAQIDYRIPDLGCEFMAANLHKWLGAPLGAGLLYVRKERVADIAPLFGNSRCAEDDIQKLAHFGTMPPSTILAIEDAIAFHNSIGGSNKEARLRYLKNYWIEQAQALARIDILTPVAPERSCAIAAFRIDGMEAKAVSETLFERHRIFTVATMAEGRGAVRVTPHLYNTTQELDSLIAALAQLVA